MKKSIYNKGDFVKFRHGGILRTGKVTISDRYNFGKNGEQVTYDIYSEEENCLYKHIDESDVIEKC